jgi:glycosyltransferase involved in cell wall biosynthesis
MHVLHVISGLDHRLGGPVHAILGLGTYQRRLGLDVTVVSAQREGDDEAIADELKQAGVNVVQVGPVRGSLGRHPAMRRVIEEHLAHADVAHLHAVWDDIQHVAAGAAWRSQTPYIIRPCGMLDPWCLAQGRLKKQLYMAVRLRKHLNRAARLHFTTSTERDLVMGPLGLRSTPIVEPNGVDLSEFDSLPAAGTFRAAFPQVGARPIILFLSRLHRKKGLDILIPAFANADVGDAMLVLVGPDDRGYQRTVEELMAAHGVVDRVVLTGLLRGVDRLAALVDASFFVLPSYQENFGVAVVEALAAGLPVVISDQVNIHDEVKAARVGAVTRTDVDDVARALTEWIQNDEMRQAAAARARGFVRERYDWARIAERWAGHYAVITGKS